ncbi:MAG: glycogen synthase GlgA [Pseudomonadota bacterium]
MRVLIAASECAPLVKTGGLADVIGALPGALAGAGVEARVMLPGYPPVLAALDAVTDLGPVDPLPDGIPGSGARVLAAEAAGLSLLVLDAPALFVRQGGIYESGGMGWPDNHLRFGAFCRAVAEIGVAGAAGWRPDVVHLNDWQTGLVPLFLEREAAEAGVAAPPTLITIHNIAYQGLFGREAIGALGLPPSGFTPEGYEFWGEVGFLKAGIQTADAITTVSPGYAREILTPAFGMGLEGVLAARRDRLSGILNGADTAVWNPAADPHLPAAYSAAEPAGKDAAKAALIAHFGLEREGAGPLLVVVSRLTAQKGIDLLLAALPGFLARGGRFALLGSGDAALEASVQAAAKADPDRVGVVIGYDESLAHLLFAGGDAIAVPSRFEPCGLTQLYGLRYGTLPLVARTGGLGDTVIDANPAARAMGVATGFVFAPATVDALAGALDRLADAWAEPAVWQGMMARAMAQPVGWEASAGAYAALYGRLAAGDG